MYVCARITTPPAPIARTCNNRGLRAFSESKLSQRTTHGAVALSSLCDIFIMQSFTHENPDLNIMSIKLFHNDSKNA